VEDGQQAPRTLAERRPAAARRSRVAAGAGVSQLDAEVLRYLRRRPMTIDADAVYRRASDVRFQRYEEQAIVLCQQRAEPIGLNGVGARVIELCDGLTSFGVVLDQLEDEYDVDRPTLEVDTFEFVEEMVELGVLVRGES
jgi:hypothetical protein